MTLAELAIDEPRLRVAEHDARTALNAIVGQPAVQARARLRFGPGRTCEPLARLLDRAVVRAESAGLDPALLIVADASASAAEDIVRVRRTGFGAADWIASPACRVRIVLLPAGLHATAGTGRPEPAGPREPPAEPAGPPAPAAPPAGAAEREPEPAGERTAAVRAALAEVIDPDLGVNIVDLGFVRAVAVQERTAVITMTLTSAACPLTSVMESQIRAGLATPSVAEDCGIEDFRVDWQWVPAWRPADITDSGRQQLRAIGFNV
jgi:metal-sulfur cluster biosynthetic enzyme/ribosomal protein L22